MFNVFWQVSYVRCWESGCARQHSSGLTSAAVPEVGKKAGGFTVRRGKNWRFISGIHSRTSASGRRCSVNGPQFHSILAQVHGNTSSRASNALLCVSTLHSTPVHFGFTCVVPRVTKVLQDSPHGGHSKSPRFTSCACFCWLEIDPLCCHIGQWNLRQARRDTCTRSKRISSRYYYVMTVLFCLTILLSVILTTKSELN